MNNLPNFIPYDLGVSSDGKKIIIFGNLLNFSDNSLFTSVSTNGTNFKSANKKSEMSFDSKTIPTSLLNNFRISKIGKEYYLTYKNMADTDKPMAIARSKDQFSWEKIGDMVQINETACIVPDLKIGDKFVAFFGDKNISIAYSSNLINWEIGDTVLTPRNNYFDAYPLQVGNVFNTTEGILVVYYIREFFREGLNYSVGIALFDKDDPKKLISRSTKPVCTQQLEAEKGELYPLGAVELNSDLFLYFGIRGKDVYAISFGKFNDIFNGLPGRTKPRLEKHDKNPIITPVMHHAWQSDATFNPAAVHDGEKFHFIYRAMGPQNTSVLGHAESKNGTDIDYRSDEPIYTPRKPFETPGGNPKRWFMSGGGYGGCEDPRVTWIKEDQKFYLTYIAYNGANAPRVALSSISEENFRNKNWDWKEPKLISKPNEVNKNAVVFPEKIGGKYVVMHRVFPNILVDLLDDLDFNNPRYLKGEFKIPPTVDGWDSRKVGAGPPPIKTADGWLLIYHAVDDKNDSQYKIGAMLLDLNEPWKVLHRTQQPILEPDQWYENNGFKAGVAYPCGAVINDNRLFVYYGGADKFICVASKNIDEFLNELKIHHNVKLETKMENQTVIHHA